MPTLALAYSLGICTGVGVALTLLAVMARLRVLETNALLENGCLFAGVCLLLAGGATWFRLRTKNVPELAGGNPINASHE